VALHVLLFSSNEKVASDLSQSFALADMEVEVSSEILRAVEDLTTRTFDAIVSDWDEGAEGSFLIRTARELKCTRNCVVLALVSDAAGAAGAIQSGAHGILHRPIDAGELSDAIEALHELASFRTADCKKQSATVSEAPVEHAVTSEPLPKKAVPQPVSSADFHAITSRVRPAGQVFDSKQSPEWRSEPTPTWNRQDPANLLAEVMEAGQGQEKAFERKHIRLALWSAMLLACAAMYTWAPESSYSLAVASAGLAAYDQVTQAPEPELIRPSDEDFALKATPVLTKQLLRSLGPVPPQPSLNLPHEWIEEADTNGEVVVPSGREEISEAEQGADQQAKMQLSPMTTPDGQLPQSLRSPVLTAAGRVGGMAPPNSLPSLLQPIVLSEELARKLLVSHTTPLYPQQALHTGVQGAVLLQAWIGKDGNIKELKIVRGPLLLGRAAFDAVKQWRFQPYVFNGQPTEAETLITVNFRLPSIGQNLQKISSFPTTMGLEAR
jgi:protein TonB